MNEYTPTTGAVRAAYTRAMRHAFIASTGEHIAEFDRWLAEVERAAAKNAEERARVSARSWVKASKRLGKLVTERDAALSTIAKVEGLHQPFEWSFGFGPVTSCKGCADQGVQQENASWPCPTIRALGSVPSTGEGNDD